MYRIQLDKIELLAIKNGGKIRNFIANVRFSNTMTLVSENDLIIYSDLTEKQYNEQSLISTFFYKCPVTGIKGYLIEDIKDELVSSIKPVFKSEVKTEQINDGIKMVNIQIKEVKLPDVKPIEIIKEVIKIEPPIEVIKEIKIEEPIKKPGRKSTKK